MDYEIAHMEWNCDMCVGRDPCYKFVVPLLSNDALALHRTVFKDGQVLGHHYCAISSALVQSCLVTVKHATVKP